MEVDDEEMSRRLENDGFEIHYESVSNISNEQEDLLSSKMDQHKRQAKLKSQFPGTNSRRKGSLEIDQQLYLYIQVAIS